MHNNLILDKLLTSNIDVIILRNIVYIVSMLEKIAKKLGNKVVVCPSCGQKLRVPVRLGKTLRVNCSRCHAVFDIHFQNPFATRAFKIKLLIALVAVIFTVVFLSFYRPADAPVKSDEDNSIIVRER